MEVVKITHEVTRHKNNEGLVCTKSELQFWHLGFTPKAEAIRELKGIFTTLQIGQLTTFLGYITPA